MFFKEVCYVPQRCIYLINNTVIYFYYIILHYYIILYYTIQKLVVRLKERVIIHNKIHKKNPF